MNRKITDAIHSIHHLDYMAGRDTILTRMHPVVKILTTFAYIVLVVSIQKYNLAGALLLGVFPVLIGALGDISLKTGLKNMRMILLLVCAVGILNPFFDRQVLLVVGDFKITGGMFSLMTLLLKGVWTVLAAYLLIASTSIENICFGLRCLHVPRSFVTILLLIYRYIIVLLKEVERMSQAYSLRAPKQKGIHIRVWGSFVGMLLLRTMDRAQEIYESMTLRGFQGEFVLDRPEHREKSKNVTDKN